MIVQAMGLQAVKHLKVSARAELEKASALRGGRVWRDALADMTKQPNLGSDTHVLGHSDGSFRHEQSRDARCRHQGPGSHHGFLLAQDIDHSVAR